MERVANGRGAVRAARVAMLVALAASGVSVAGAVEPKAVDGILQFPNVRVIAAPELASSTAAPQGGLRAYKDGPDGALRGPTTEEMAASGRQAAGTARRASTSDAAAAADRSFAAGSGVGLALDDSSLQYSVVVRQPDGSLAEVCVTGEDAAAAVVKQSSVVKPTARKEVPNVR